MSKSKVGRANSQRGTLVLLKEPKKADKVKHPCSTIGKRANRDDVLSQRANKRGIGQDFNEKSHFTPKFGRNPQIKRNLQ